VLDHLMKLHDQVPIVAIRLPFGVVAGKRKPSADAGDDHRHPKAAEGRAPGA